ncbi:hypothetical protein DFH06DRAFT_1132477 [Mycena polygramma]|nr:hypothetical protein DFH06DRAFT_1132477 [Mycena polygramma]
MLFQPTHPGDLIYWPSDSTQANWIPSVRQGPPSARVSKLQSHVFLLDLIVPFGSELDYTRRGSTRSAPGQGGECGHNFLRRRSFDSSPRSGLAITGTFLLPVKLMRLARRNRSAQSQPINWGISSKIPRAIGKQIGKQIRKIFLEREIYHERRGSTWRAPEQHTARTALVSSGGARSTRASAIASCLVIFFLRSANHPGIQAPKPNLLVVIRNHVRTMELVFLFTQSRAAWIPFSINLRPYLFNDFTWRRSFDSSPRHQLKPKLFFRSATTFGKDANWATKGGVARGVCAPGQNKGNAVIISCPVSVHTTTRGTKGIREGGVARGVHRGKVVVAIVSSGGARSTRAPAMTIASSYQADKLEVTLLNIYLQSRTDNSEFISGGVARRVHRGKTRQILPADNQVLPPTEPHPAGFGALIFTQATWLPTDLLSAG